LEALKHLEIAQTRYPQVGLALQLEFEKLVVLDYIIRNTDRTFNNWLFAVEWREPMEDRVVSRMPLPPADLDSKAAVAIKIVGIDNGLSFPWKHPDQWRSYPYSWIDMKQAQVPFSELIRRQLLPILRDASSWDDLINTKLKPIFQLDNAFSERFFRLQMSVMRGQMRNLIIALESGYSPYKMVKELPPIRIEADDEFFERRYGSRTDRGGFELDAFFTNSERKLWKKKVQARPCFSIF
jgi:phosphatidylinositol 4-kinase type 2